MTRAAATKRDKGDHSESFDLSRARMVRRGPRRDRSPRLSLRALRVAAGRTQMELSEATDIDQGDVSKLERRASLDEFSVSTLRRYVEGLGARLEIVAVFSAGQHIVVAPPDKEEAVPAKLSPSRRSRR